MFPHPDHTLNLDLGGGIFLNFCHSHKDLGVYKDHNLSPVTFWPGFQPDIIGTISGFTFFLCCLLSTPLKSRIGLGIWLSDGYSRSPFSGQVSERPVPRNRNELDLPESCAVEGW